MNGLLGNVNITTTGNIKVYTVPADTYTVLSLNICNRSTSTQAIKVAIADGTDIVTDADYIEYDTDVFANNVLERTGIVLNADQRLIIQATGTPSLTATVWGLETSTVV